MLETLTMSARQSRTSTPGFSLIELMVTLVVLAILATIAAPSFNDLLERRKVSGLASAITNDVQLVRTEALKRSRLVTVSFSDTGHSVTIKHSSAPVVIRAVSYADQHRGVKVTPFGNTTPVVFNPMLGRLADPVGGVHGIRVTGQRGHEIELEINPIGKITTCGNFGGLPTCP